MGCCATQEVRTRNPPTVDLREVQAREEIHNKPPPTFFSRRRFAARARDGKHHPLCSYCGFWAYGGLLIPAEIKMVQHRIPGDLIRQDGTCTADIKTLAMAPQMRLAAYQQRYGVPDQILSNDSRSTGIINCVDIWYYKHGTCFGSCPGSLLLTQV
jgi:hypothetical protein